MHKPYLDFVGFLRSRFPYKVQKISLHAGCTCPNRDGTQGIGGCIYCNNAAFSPAYTQTLRSVSDQLRSGVDFFAYKYPEMRYLAYFQSYTSTYGSADQLIRCYEEALQADHKVVGIVVGTRPDCMSRELLDYFEALSKRVFVLIEYGIESTKDTTLRLINRGHTYRTSVEAIERTAARGLPVGGHLILGLPTEREADFRHHAYELSQLPLTVLKLHQLQILKGTRLASVYHLAPDTIPLLCADEYIRIAADFVAHLRPDIYIDRFVSQSPETILLAPRWNIKNHVFTQRLISYMELNALSQGCLYDQQPTSYHTT